MNLNKALIIGRVTADPQLRSTPTGQAVTSFGVATNRQWKDKNGNRQEDVEFHNVVVWGRQAEVACQYLKKGALVYIEGHLRTRSWQDKQNQTHRTTEIICDNLQLGPRSQSGGGLQAVGDDLSRAPTQNVAGVSQKPYLAQAPAFAEALAGKTDDKSPSEEEIPVVDIEDDIKPEDLPF